MSHPYTTEYDPQVYKKLLTAMVLRFLMASIATLAWLFMTINVLMFGFVHRVPFVNFMMMLASMAILVVPLFILIYLYVVAHKALRPVAEDRAFIKPYYKLFVQYLHTLSARLPDQVPFRLNVQWKSREDQQLTVRVTPKDNLEIPLVFVVSPTKIEVVSGNRTPVEVFPGLRGVMVREDVIAKYARRVTFDRLPIQQNADDQLSPLAIVDDDSHQF